MNSGLPVITLNIEPRKSMQKKFLNCEHADTKLLGSYVVGVKSTA